MRIVIVGQKDGKAVIRWPQYLGISFSLAMVIGLGSGLVYSLLSGRWSHECVLSGIGIGVAIVGIGLLNGLRTPPEKLTPID